MKAMRTRRPRRALCPTTWPTSSSPPARPGGPRPSPAPTAAPSTCSPTWPAAGSLPKGARASLWTSFSFDVSISEAFAALLSGGCLEIAPDALRADPAAFVSWLAERRIESAYVPPFALPELARRLEGGLKMSLRRTITAVEPVPEALFARIAAAVPGLAVVDAYGPTEATVYCTGYRVDARTAGAGMTPIGVPLANTRAVVLDRRLEPVPVGVPGELAIGGWGLARGYFGRPDATAEKLVPDPGSSGTEPGARGLLGAELGARLYRTGDLVRWRADGQLEFLGRIDRQVKLRGFRIELGEIEAALAAHPAVAEVAVAVLEGHADAGSTPGGAESGARDRRRLVAFLVPAPGARPEELEPAELRAFLARRLPEPMLPNQFVPLAAMPLTPVGKLDRRGLLRLAPDPAAAGEGREAVAPRGEAEAVLAGIWTEVLGLGRRGLRAGVHDNFFELGGNSIL